MICLLAGKVAGHDAHAKDRTQSSDFRSQRNNQRIRPVRVIAPPRSRLRTRGLASPAVTAGLRQSVRHAILLRIIRNKVRMRLFQPLRGRSMALLWGGLSLSAVGDQLYTVALTWIAVGVLGSNAGYLSALQAFVGLSAVLGVGFWADRWEPLRGMIGADLACALVLIVVVAAASFSGGPGITMLVLPIVVLALGRAVFQPALQSVLPFVVADTRLLPAANGLLDATGRIARLLGPGLVALLVGMVPVIHFLTLDAFTFLASAVALWLIWRRHPAETPKVQRAIPRQSIWRGVVRGYRATASHPLLGYFLAMSAPLNGVWYAVFYLCLPFMLARGGVGADGLVGIGAYGLILSAYGCGNLAATVVLGGRALPARPQFLMLSGNLVGACGIVSLAAANFLPAEWRLTGFSAASALTACGGPMQDIPVAVLRQTRLGPPDVAPAMRAFMAMTGFGILCAMLLIPAAIDWFGVTRVIIACGGVYFCVAALGLARFAGWHEVIPEVAA
jgi:MFS transporter, DHA3 family, macrolide efflux protein